MTRAQLRSRLQALASVFAAATLATVLLAAAGQGIDGRAAAETVTSDPGGRTAIIVEQVRGPGGEVTRVRLDGWPAGPVTVSVCGNDGVRASQDCDLIGAKGVGVERNGSASTIIAMTPPVGCPCVVRVATADSALVRTLPVALPGVPMLTPEQRLPDPFVAPSASELVVSAVVEDDPSWGQRLIGAFGGPVRRTGVITLRNEGGVRVTELSATAAVGRTATSGEPVPVPVVGALEPGEQRVVRAPFAIGAPSAGTSLLFGRITGLDRPVSFQAQTEVKPWGLYALAVAAPLLLARRWRRRRARRAASVPAGASPSIGDLVPRDLADPATGDGDAAPLDLDELVVVGLALAAADRRSGGDAPAGRGRDDAAANGG